MRKLLRKEKLHETGRLLDWMEKTADKRPHTELEDLTIRVAQDLLVSSMEIQQLPCGCTPAHVILSQAAGNLVALRRGEESGSKAEIKLTNTITEIDQARLRFQNIGDVPAEAPDEVETEGHSQVGQDYIQSGNDELIAYHIPEERRTSNRSESSSSGEAIPSGHHTEERNLDIENEGTHSQLEELENTETRQDRVSLRQIHRAIREGQNHQLTVTQTNV
ncbi:hypothetical protein R1sor_026940 [Riccia sorocarpa]|uniref:Uncharacterized protein n=1 Tax=Riccia sorocarpa TaxID=122646 RepID=A0ABD3GEJ9_9MARC